MRRGSGLGNECGSSMSSQDRGQIVPDDSLHATDSRADETEDPLIAAPVRAVVWYRNTRLLVLTAFSGIAGFLFGYDTGNISGALPYIKDELLTAYESTPSRLHVIEGLIVSGAVIGAAIGSATGGYVSDRLGRKAALKTADVFFLVGSVTMASSQSATLLIIGRVILGLGIGLASVTAPVYIAETAPAPVRATLVTFNTLMITCGQLAAYFLSYLFTFTHSTWRWMVGIAAVPAAVQMIGLLFLPESPRQDIPLLGNFLKPFVIRHLSAGIRILYILDTQFKWLLFKGRDEEAHRVLSALRHPADQKEEFRIQANSQPTQSLWERLRSEALRKELHLGMGLQIWQQLCGINTVMYYTPSILRLAGVTDNRTALLLAMGPAAVNAMGTVVGMYLVDILGRRKLLLGSLAGIVVALLLLGTSFRLSESHTSFVVKSSCPTPGIITCAACIQDGCRYCPQQQEGSERQVHGECIAADETCSNPDFLTSNGDGCPNPYFLPIILSVILYLAMFSPGMGTVPWCVNAEIFPVEVRGLGNGAAATANWVTNAVVSQFFLTLADFMGTSGVFWFLAGVALLGSLWVHTYLPETKGLSFDAVQRLFSGTQHPRQPSDPHDLSPDG